MKPSGDDEGKPQKAPTDTLVHQLRRRWKPHKVRLAARRSDHPTNVRFHRACSWLQRGEDAHARQDVDTMLLSQWIAFNALYGRWDPSRGEPQGDRSSWRAFTDRLLVLDADARVAELLERKKKLVLAILDDSYLAGFFWRDPSNQRALSTTRDRRLASQWYAAGQWSLALDAVLERVYLLRCQLIHGAATWNSRLNRDSLRRCTGFMDEWLPVALAVWIDHGADEDWGPMCYPPQL